jgi:hypothetical protein
MYTPSEGTIMCRLRDLDLEVIRQVLNDKLEIYTVKNVFRKFNVFTIDFVNIPYYRKEKNSNDIIKTKHRQGTSRYYTYTLLYLILKK